MAALHDQARRHRTADPDTFDTTWASMGEPLPAWLTVDPSLLQTARTWIATETFTAERDHLAANLELLDPDSDVAVDEALLQVDDQEAQGYQALRTAAQTDGVHAAYRPVLLTVLAGTFASADPARRRELLAHQHEDLVDPLVLDRLDQLTQLDDDTLAVPALVARLLLDLAQHDQHEMALDALDRPDRFPALLQDLAGGLDLALLGSVAELALFTAPDSSAEATARWYLAVAATADGDLLLAEEHLTQAVALDPAQLPIWLTEVATIGARHPQTLGLIALLSPHLTTPATVEPTAPPAGPAEGTSS